MTMEAVGTGEINIKREEETNKKLLFVCLQLSLQLK